MRLIDADALLKEDFIDSFVDFYDNTVFEAIVEEAPTIDIKTEVAREIFEEIERNIQAKINSMPFDEWEDGYFIGARGTLIRILHEITELKNKYTKEGAE